MSNEANAHDEEEDWLRLWTVPEEDRGNYTPERWRGEHRWFRAPNVICLDTWRRKARSCPGNAVQTEHQLETSNSLRGPRGTDV
jgi:hypothetical protein